VSPTLEQRAQVLYLYHVEGVSVVIIAVMVGLSRSTVKRVLSETSRQDVPVVGKSAAVRPSSKGRIERQIQHVRNDLPTSAPQREPARRRHRKERRHDRS
jgi:DNA-binding transcriptional regulator LsrR (DeoR family)